MGVLRKLSVLIFFLALPSFLPPSSENSPFCSLVAWASHTSSFGNHGVNGSNGRVGRAGRNGENQTIFVNGTALNLDLSGTDGEDGEDGRRGGHANCYSQPQHINHNLQAANGGRGGDGGNGGNGGNGGTLTLYYSEIADLRNITLRSLGGRGGRNGRAAPGGQGCRCSKHSWEYEVCTGTPGSSDHRCTTQRFHCRDGSNGGQGREGRNGTDGQRGQLVLINQPERLASDQPNVTLSLSQIGRPISLSRNQWQRRNGATSLLAPGSVVADSYLMYTGRLEKQFELVWNAEESIRNFSNQRIQLNLENNSNITVNVPEELWLESTTSRQDNLTQMIVTHAIHRDEVTRLRPAEFAGNGAQLTFSLVDLAGKSDLVDTRFWVRYRTSQSDPWRVQRPLDYQTRYEGNISPTLVSRQGNRFTLDLGQLPISADHRRAGMRVELEVVATRSFAGKSADQRLTWRGEIPR